MWSIPDQYRLAAGGVTIEISKPRRIWTVAEAKTHLSEILRLAEVEGPQIIGTRRSFVVVPANTWYAKTSPRKPLGKWLVENTPRGIELEIPSRHDPYRAIPFSDGDEGSG